MTKPIESAEFDKEFGQRCVRIPGGVLTVAGPELTIDVDGKVYPFEWHSYCGPIPLNRRGDPKALGPRHRFWSAVTHWAQQGKRLDEKRKAVWEHPPEEDLSKHVRVGRNLYPPEMYERISAKLATEGRK